MKPSSTIIGTVVLLLLLHSPVQAAEHVTRLFAQAGSTVTVKGDNNFHSWVVQGKEPEGSVEFAAGFPSTAGQIVKLGKTQARMKGCIPVRSLHISDGRAIDEAMYHLLREDENPRICFIISELSLKALPKTNDEPYLFDSRAEFVVAGVTNRFSLPLGVLPLADHKLKITGSTSVKMTDFEINPPQIKLSGQNFTLSYRDRIEISFEWFVGPNPEPALQK